MVSFESKKTRSALTHYPRDFLLQAGIRTTVWLIFLPLFIILGKSFAEMDPLRKIAQFFGKDWSFNQYFLGTGRQAEKSKILNLAIYFILAIIFLNLLALLFNSYLWNKDRYLENNNFYLHNKWIFILNSLVHIASAFLLTFSLISVPTIVLTLLFITFNTWDFWIPQKSPSPQLEKFFTWKNSYVRKILLYSAIVILVIPWVIGYFQNFHQAAKGATEGFARTYQEMINSSNAIKSFVELITKANYSLFHWVILAWFAKGLISERFGEFSSFWTKVNGIEKKTSNFKHYYYYQESWAQANRTSINLSDYKFLENSPNFLSQEYLEGDLEVNQFAQRNRQVVHYIEFCGQRIKQPSKRNFLNYCLFNEFKSWEDCLRTQELMKKVKLA